MHPQQLEMHTPTHIASQTPDWGICLHCDWLTLCTKRQSERGSSHLYARVSNIQGLFIHHPSFWQSCILIFYASPCDTGRELTSWLKSGSMSCSTGDSREISVAIMFVCATYCRSVIPGPLEPIGWNWLSVGGLRNSKSTKDQSPVVYSYKREYRLFQ